MKWWSCRKSKRNGIACWPWEKTSWSMRRPPLPLLTVGPSRQQKKKHLWAQCGGHPRTSKSTACSIGKQWPTPVSGGTLHFPACLRPSRRWPGSLVSLRWRIASSTRVSSNLDWIAATDIVAGYFPHQTTLREELCFSTTVQDLHDLVRFGFAWRKHWTKCSARTSEGSELRIKWFEKSHSWCLDWPWCPGEKRSTRSHSSCRGRDVCVARCQEFPQWASQMFSTGEIEGRRCGPRWEDFSDRVQRGFGEEQEETCSHLRWVFMPLHSGGVLRATISARSRLRKKKIRIHRVQHWRCLGFRRVQGPSHAMADHSQPEREGFGAQGLESHNRGGAQHFGTH